VSEHPLRVRSRALQVEAQSRQAAQDDADARVRSLDAPQPSEQPGQRVPLPCTVVSQ
jgi:hypothetical protein